MVDEIDIVANVRRPQYFPQWKVTSIIWKMEDNLNYLEKGRRPQLYGKWKTTLIFSKSKMTQANERPYKFLFQWNMTSNLK